MPNVELVTADVEVIRDAAAQLRHYGEDARANRLDALADYLDTAIHQAIGEAPMEHF